MRAPEFWNKRQGFARALGLALSPLGSLYGLSVRIKQSNARPHRTRARVICVGNLTAGGTGKTPIAIALGKILLGQGRRVVFLTRGYGGNLAGPVQVDRQAHSAFEVGDEPLLLAAIAPTVVARDRGRGAALADELGADIIVMDDGFQNFSIAKDLSLLVIDEGLGNGRLIPAGPLREQPKHGFARAHAIVAMGEEGFVASSFSGPTLRARIEPSDRLRLQGKTLLAFCGIGRPEKFFRTLKGTGATLAGMKSFPDHHRYSRADIEWLRMRADALCAHLVTTEKDFVRLDEKARESVLPVPIHAVFQDMPAVSSLLARVERT